MSSFPLSAHSSDCIFINSNTKDNSKELHPVSILRFHEFSQLGVKEKAVALIIQDCRSVQVLREGGIKVNIPSHSIEMLVIRDITKLKLYLSRTFVRLVQLSDNSYKVLVHPRGVGGGGAQAKLAFKSQLTQEEKKELKSYLKKDQNFEKGLQRALMERNFPIIKLLLKAGAHPTIPQDEKIEIKTLKQWVAGDKEEREVARLLIEAGADVRELEDINRTSLVDAIEKTDEPLALALIKAGLKVNLKAPYDEPNLHLALSRKLKRVVHALIQAHVDVNASNSKGESPLASLVNARDNWQETDLKELLNALLNAGAKINEQDSSSINDVITLIRDRKEIT